jgi:hypothetical protein
MAVSIFAHVGSRITFASRWWAAALDDDAMTRRFRRSRSVLTAA